MIELLHVSKSFDGGQTFAVEGLSLRVERGECVALIGGSGCGKTTTLKMVNRLVEPTEGAITVDGEDVTSVDPVLLRRRIGYVFQGIGLFPHYSVAENVGVVPNLMGWERDRAEQRVQETLEIVGLDPDTYADRRPSELSGGQQQRVGVARALAAEPELMLMDEPFGALDPITRSDIQDHFQRIREELNLTTIMVTHDMTEALLLADRVAVMQEGEILQVGTPQELVGEPQHPYVRELVEMPKRRADQVEAILQVDDSNGGSA